MVVGEVGLLSFVRGGVERCWEFDYESVHTFTSLPQGIFFPAFYSMAGYWWPVSERALLGAIQGTGGAMGSTLSFAMSGIICSQLGWQWVFWIYSKKELLYSLFSSFTKTVKQNNCEFLLVHSKTRSRFMN